MTYEKMEILVYIQGLDILYHQWNKSLKTVEFPMGCHSFSHQSTGKVWLVCEFASLFLSK